MAHKSSSRAKSVGTHSGGAGDKDRTIAELKDRIAVLENELVERERAEGALRAGEEMYRSLVESIGDWVWETDENFVLTYDSPRIREVLGYGPNEVIGRTPFSFMPEDELEGIKLHAGPAIARHEPIHRVENRLVKKDGSIVTVETSGIPLFDGSGRYRGYRGVTQDITGRKRAEEALRKSEEKYRSIVETANEGVWIVDRDTRATFVNDEMAGMLGYTKEEMLGKRIEDFVGESDLALLRSSLDMHLSSVKVRHDIPLRRKDGSRLWCIVSATPLLDDGGNFAGGVGMVTDITERRRMTEKLAQNEKFIRNVFECIQDGISVLDRGLNVIEVNPAMEKRYGHVMGKKCFQAYHGRSEPCEACPSLRAIKTGTTQTEVVYDLKGWSEIYAFPLINDRGEVTGIIEHVRDINERKRAEKALMREKAILTKSQEVAHLGNWAWDLEAGEFTASDECYRIYGYKPGDVKPTREWLLSRILPEDRALMAYHMDARIKDGKQDNFDFRIMKPDGSITYVNTIVDKSVRDKTGKVTKLYGINQDVTERRQAEEALRESEEKYRIMVEHSRDVSWKIDLAGTWMFISGNVEGVIGLKPAEVVGRKVWDFLAPECHGLVRDKLRRRAAGEDLPPYEVLVIGNDGRRTPFEVSTAPILDGSGKIIGVQGVSRDITERKRAEEALRESKERYRIVADNTYDWEFWLGPDGRFLYTSPSCARVTGYTAEEFMDRPGLLHEIIHPDDLTIFLNHRHEELPSRNGDVEFRIIAKGGEVKWIHHICQPVHDEGGHYAGSRGSNRDITERKRAEEALVSERSQLLSIFESIDDVVYVTDPYTYEVLYANKAMKVTFGGDLVGGVCYREFQRRDSPCDFCTNSIILKEPGKPYKWEYYNPTVDRYFLITDRIIKWSDGRDVRFEIAKDITDRRLAEEALRESEKKFRVVAETSPAAIFLYQGEKYLYVNPMAETLTGYSRDELMAGDAWEWIHPEFKDLVKDRARKRQMGEPVPSQYEAKYRAKDGREGWVDFSAGLIEYGGKPAGLATAFDVTPRRRAEEELKSAKQQAELYLDLMAHDINNMHQVALGYLEMAKDMPPGEGQTALLDKPVEVLQRSTKLIGNVRMLQKFREGAYKTWEVDVCGLLVALRSEYGAMSGKTVTLHLNGHEHCTVLANELLHDVYANLVNNAVKHTGDRAEITVSLDLVEDGVKRFCRVAVEDNGPGIPDEAKKKIFNRMHMGSARGMGLGLYIVRTLVTSYGGRVWAEDRVQGDHTKGARFVVMLPAVDK